MRTLPIRRPLVAQDACLKWNGPCTSCWTRFAIAGPKPSVDRAAQNGTSTDRTALALRRDAIISAFRVFDTNGSGTLTYKALRDIIGRPVYNSDQWDGHRTRLTEAQLTGLFGSRADADTLSIEDVAELWAASWDARQWGDDSELLIAAAERFASGRAAPPLTIAQALLADAAAAAEKSTAANRAAASEAAAQRTLPYKLRRAQYVSEIINLGTHTTPTPDGMRMIHHVKCIRSWHDVADPDEVAALVRYRDFGAEFGEVAGHVTKPVFPQEWFEHFEVPVYVWSLDRTAGQQGSFALSHQLWDILTPFQEKGVELAQALLLAGMAATPLRGTNSATDEQTNDADGAPTRQTLLRGYPLRSSMLQKHRPGGAHGSYQGLIESMVLKWMDPLCKGTPGRSRTAMHFICFELPDGSGIVSCRDAYMALSGGKEGVGRDLKVAWSTEKSCAVPRFGMQVSGSALQDRLNQLSRGAEDEPPPAECPPTCTPKTQCSGCGERRKAEKVRAAAGMASKAIDAMTAAREASAFTLAILAAQRPDLRTSEDAVGFTMRRFMDMSLGGLASTSSTADASSIRPRTRRAEFMLGQKVLTQFPGDPDKEPGGGWVGDSYDPEEEYYWPSTVKNTSYLSSTKMLTMAWCVQQQLPPPVPPPPPSMPP